MKSARFLLIVILSSFLFVLCKNENVWKPGQPFPIENLFIGIIHSNDPFTDKSGYSYAHELGINEMIKNFNLDESQVIRKVNVFAGDSGAVEETIRDCIAMGVNVIIAASWDYMEACEKLADEFPNVIFAHTSGNRHNDKNFTNFSGRVYQAKYLSGIIAGLQTKTGKIGFVAPLGIDNSEVTGNLNAFAMGVDKANPYAQVYVKVVHSWFDPLGEAEAARALIAIGCDIITQNTDSPVPQIEAQKAGVWGIGFNTDMSADAPDTILTSVFWNWSVYYTRLIQSIINGTFTTEPWYGSLRDGIIDLAPLNENINWDTETQRTIEFERYRIESGIFGVYSGVMETNNGVFIGKIGERFFDSEIRNNINWYYRNVVVLR